MNNYLAEAYIQIVRNAELDDIFLKGEELQRSHDTYQMFSYNLINEIFPRMIADGGNRIEDGVYYKDFIFKSIDKLTLEDYKKIADLLAKEGYPVPASYNCTDRMIPDKICFDIFDQYKKSGYVEKTYILENPRQGMYVLKEDPDGMDIFYAKAARHQAQENYMLDNFDKVLVGDTKAEKEEIAG